MYNPQKARLPSVPAQHTTELRRNLKLAFKRNWKHSPKYFISWSLRKGQGGGDGNAQRTGPGWGGIFKFWFKPFSFQNITHHSMAVFTKSLFSLSQNCPQMFQWLSPFLMPSSPHLYIYISAFSLFFFYSLCVCLVFFLIKDRVYLFIYLFIYLAALGLSCGSGTF